MSPITFAKFTEIAENSGMTYKVTEQNFQRLLDIEKPLRQGKADRFDWTAYYTLEEIYDWLDALKATFPQKVTLLTIGQSYEGRTIRAVKISSRKPVNSL